MHDPHKIISVCFCQKWGEICLMFFKWMWSFWDVEKEEKFCVRGKIHVKKNMAFYKVMYYIVNVHAL